MVTQAWTWAQLPTTKNCLRNSTQTTDGGEKKFLQISNFGTLTPLQIDQN